MKKLLYFSGIKPTIEDLEFQQDGIELALSSLQSDLVSDGIVRGLSVGEGMNTGEYVVSPGAAFVKGKRVEVPEATTFQSAVNRFVVLQYSQSTSNEVSHFLTGEKHAIYGDDSFAIEVRSTDAITVGEILLAKIESDGSVSDLRTPVSLLIDERLHSLNSDTHTISPVFRIGGANGPAALTVANLLSESPELRNLLRNGLVNYLDGKGDQLLLTRKIPSQPNAPVLLLSNVQLKVYGQSSRSTELSLALDSYQAASITGQQLSSHVSAISELRSLVVAKQIAGLTLDQLRGDVTLPGGTYDHEVRIRKNELIRSGVLANTRLPGTVSVSSGSQVLTGIGTAFDNSYIGKRILIDPGATGTPVELLISSVSDATHASLSSASTVNISNGVFYFADVPEIGFGGSITTISAMLGGIDAVKSGKEQSRSLALQQQTDAATIVSSHAVKLSQPVSNQYGLFLTWAKPVLVDREEITHYLVRVVELISDAGSLSNNLTVETLEANHSDLIFRVAESVTKKRQQIEIDDAVTTVATGSTTQQIVYTGNVSIALNQRIVIGTESAIVRSVDPATKTIQLLTPLSIVPIANTPLVTKKLLFESDVRTESFSLPVEPGQRLLLFVRAVSEYGVASQWSNALAVDVNSLATGSGKTVSQLAESERQTLTIAKQIEREQVTRDLSEQLFALQRAIAEAPTQEQLDAIASSISTGAAL